MNKAYQYFDKISWIVINTSLLIMAVFFIGFVFNGINPPSEPPPVTISGEHISFEPRELLNAEMLDTYKSVYNFTIDEFADTDFEYTRKQLTSSNEHGTRAIIEDAMPIKNVFLADLNGDGIPEFCSTVVIGSGISDSRILVYDYMNDANYELSDRMFYNYNLAIENGKLAVKQYDYLSDNEKYEPRGVGSMEIVDGELVVHDIDREISIPIVESSSD